MTRSPGSSLVLPLPHNIRMPTAQSSNSTEQYMRPFKIPCYSSAIVLSVPIPAMFKCSWGPLTSDCYLCSHHRRGKYTQLCQHCDRKQRTVGSFPCIHSYYSSSKMFFPIILSALHPTALLSRFVSSIIASIKPFPTLRKTDYILLCVLHNFCKPLWNLFCMCVRMCVCLPVSHHSICIVLL